MSEISHCVAAATKNADNKTLVQRPKVNLNKNRFRLKWPLQKAYLNWDCFSSRPHF